MSKAEHRRRWQLRFRNIIRGAERRWAKRVYDQVIAGLAGRIMDERGGGAPRHGHRPPGVVVLQDGTLVSTDVSSRFRSLNFIDAAVTRNGDRADIDLSGLNGPFLYDYLVHPSYTGSDGDSLTWRGHTYIIYSTTLGALDAARAAGGRKSIFLLGEETLTSTITLSGGIPADSRISIVGDGRHSGWKSLSVDAFTLNVSFSPTAAEYWLHIIGCNFDIDDAHIFRITSGTGAQAVWLDQCDVRHLIDSLQDTTKGLFSSSTGMAGHLITNCFIYSIGSLAVTDSGTTGIGDMLFVGCHIEGVEGIKNTSGQLDGIRFLSCPRLEMEHLMKLGSNSDGCVVSGNYIRSAAGNGDALVDAVAGATNIRRFGFTTNVIRANTAGCKIVDLSAATGGAKPDAITIKANTLEHISGTGGTAVELPAASTNVDVENAYSGWAADYIGPLPTGGASGDLGILYDNGALSVGWNAFITREDNVINNISASTLNVADDDTSYVEVVGTTVSSNTTGYTLGRIPLGKVVASSGDIDSITEETAVLDSQSGIYDADGDTGWEAETSPDEDILRAKAAGSEIAAIDASGLTMRDNIIRDLANPVLGGDAVNLNTLLDSMTIALHYHFLAASVMSSVFSAGEAFETYLLDGDADVDQETDIIQVSTEADTPTPFTIGAGTLISVHFDAKVAAANKKPTVVFVQLGYVDDDGSSNFVQIGEDSDPTTAPLTTDKEEVELHIHIDAETDVPATKRLKVKWWATTTGALPDPTVHIYYGALADHITIPVSASILGNYLPLAGGTMTGGLILASTLAATPSTAQDITAAGDTLLANATIIELTADSDYTLTSTPTIAAGSDGQQLTIINVDGTDTITVQDAQVLAGSLLRLGATTRALAPNAILMLTYDAALGAWVERNFNTLVSVTPSIDSFTINGSNGLTLEIANVGTRDLTLAWTYTGVPSAGTVDVDDAGADPGAVWPATLGSPFTSLGPSAATRINDEPTTVTTVYTFTPTITVNGQELTTPTATITWLNRRYVGPHADGAALTTAEILSLDDAASGESGLSNSKVGTFTDIDTAAGEYIYYCYRSALGAVTHFSIEGEAAKFNDEGDAVNHTNDSGFAETFQQYRSETTNMGNNKDFRALSAESNNRIYIGPHTDAQIDSPGILELDDTADGESIVSGTVARTYTDIEIDAGEYLWLCHPDRVADINTIKDGTTGFGIDGSYLNNVESTNQFGYVETYRCWRSTNSGIYPDGENVVVT